MRPRALHAHRRRPADHAGRRLGRPAGDGGRRVGVGAGGRDPEGHANVLRLLVGERLDDARWRAPDDGSDVGSAVLLETNVDDLDPRLWPVRDRRAARGRRERRLADPDPDEEGPAGAHAQRPGRGRPR